MGQTPSSEIQIEKYIQHPYITKEDVFQIKNCFEYLKPVDGTIEISRIENQIESLPYYMQEIVFEIRAAKKKVNFDEFFSLMKPRIAALKSLPDDSVVMEDTSTSVFCVLCPYKLPVQLVDL